MSKSELTIEAIEAFSDNYIWLLTNNTKRCAVVDPGDATPVINTLQQRGLELSYILLTHHHPDHTGGVATLKDRFAAKVFGPHDQRIAHVDVVCSEGDEIVLDDLQATFRVLEVPAHTRSHIAYYGENALFSGDTLFSLGCGRLFEGSPSQMQEALDKLAALPADTQNYCAHEYTQSNCRFALAVEPYNEALLSRAAEIDQLRANGEITLPTSIGAELATNPFMRTREDTVISAARQIDASADAGAGTMAVIRAWKDRF